MLGETLHDTISNTTWLFDAMFLALFKRSRMYVLSCVLFLLYIVSLHIYIFLTFIFVVLYCYSICYLVFADAGSAI